MTDIRPATPADHAALLALWLASVRATHAFLDEHDIQALIPIVRDDALPNLEVWVMQQEALVSGFIGLSGAHVEALFVAPECFRQGCGQALLAHARRLKGMLTVDVNDWKVTERAPYEVTLFQALPKGKAFETILQKATELGAYRIVPLITERVVTRAEKHEKWQWVMIDAMKQCGNPWMPILDAPQKFAEAVGRVKDFDLSLVGSLHEGRRHPREWLERKKLSSVAIWVGPEGDFTTLEIEALMN